MLRGVARRSLPFSTAAKEQRGAVAGTLHVQVVSTRAVFRFLIFEGVGGWVGGMFHCSKISFVLVGFLVCGVDFSQNVLKHKNWRDLCTEFGLYVHR